ncbi:MAG: enoyl-CoA hydratase/isomerase family protein, partial [Halobacteriales archaeon]|nr:enoyl-CoA hydratase/isomerase family protein [Halobacteriales archaeon]
MTSPVTTAVDGRIATVTIDRPEKLHALNRAVLKGLVEAFSDLPDEVCVAILRTTEDRAFIAGADMNEFQQATDRDDFLAFQKLEREANLAIATAPPVVIAAVDGVAFGGGFEVALACDLMVAGEGVEMGFPEVKRGLTPGATG